MDTIGLAKDGRHVLLRPLDPEGWEEFATFDGALIGSWFDQDIDEFVGWGLVTDKNQFLDGVRGALKDDDVVAWGNLPPLDGRPR